MALFGICMETWKPYQGCTTLRTDLNLDRLPGWYATIADMDRSVRYRFIDYPNLTIEIQYKKLCNNGYTFEGQYYGNERNKLYEIFFDDKNSLSTYTVRAPNRQALRRILQKLYPDAKVGR